MQDNFHRPDDHEAKMARADLFKCAQYSFKLFKMIQEDQELEGWVQAKITKAADYIASVYHYMEYEMKISEYGDSIENADMYSESIRRAFAQKLTEAKAVSAKMKAKAEKELDEERSSTGGEIDRSKKGVTKHTSGSNYSSMNPSDEEGSGKGKGTHAKSQSAADKKSDKSNDIKLPKHGGNTWGMKGGEKFGKKMEGTMAPVDVDGATAPPLKGKDGQYPIVTSGPNKGKRWSPKTPGPTNPAMKEGAKPDFLDMDKDGNKKEPMKKAVADKKKKTDETFMPVKKDGPTGPIDKLKQTMKKPLPPGSPDEDVYAKRAKSGKYKSELELNTPEPVQEMSPFAKVKEAADKCNHSAKGEKCPVHGLKECGGMYEGNKFDPLKHVKNPTKGEKDAAKDVKRGSYADRAAMLKSAEADGRLKNESTGDYSAKKAAAGKDIGKPGKNFAKIEKSAGGGEKGKKIAGAVLAKLRAKG